MKRKITSGDGEAHGQRTSRSPPKPLISRGFPRDRPRRIRWRGHQVVDDRRDAFARPVGDKRHGRMRSVRIRRPDVVALLADHLHLAAHEPEEAPRTAHGRQHARLVEAVVSLLHVVLEASSRDDLHGGRTLLRRRQAHRVDVADGRAGGQSRDLAPRIDVRAEPEVVDDERRRPVREDVLRRRRIVQEVALAALRQLAAHHVERLHLGLHERRSVQRREPVALRLKELAQVREIAGHGNRDAAVRLRRKRFAIDLGRIRRIVRVAELPPARILLQEDLVLDVRPVRGMLRAAADPDPRVTAYNGIGQSVPAEGAVKVEGE